MFNIFHNSLNHSDFRLNNKIATTIAFINAFKKVFIKNLKEKIEIKPHYVESKYF